MTKNTTVQFVQRPFADLTGETDLVALRELVPAASVKVKLTSEYGGHEVTLVTILPLSWAALRREGGDLQVALRTNAGSGDASRDLADIILQGIELKPGQAIKTARIPEVGPRLQDILDLDFPFEPVVHEGFEFLVDEGRELDPNAKESLQEANETIIDTVLLPGVQSAYWCSMNGTEFLRWALRFPQEKILDGIARLHAERKSGFAGSKFLGAFRAAGIVIPVWQLPKAQTAEETAVAAKAFEPTLLAAIESEEPLDANQRRARAGIVARQVTLR